MAGAIIIAVLLQIAWAAVCLSQLEYPLTQLCIGPCEPVDRPSSDGLLLVAIPVVGSFLSVMTGALFGFSYERLNTWLIFLFGVPLVTLVVLGAIWPLTFIALLTLGGS